MEKKIIVVGDIMIDINYNSEVNRNAPESNDIPIYNILDKNYILGGSANVAFNLKNLGVNIELIGLIGNDLYGRIVKDLLDEQKIDNKLFIDNERNTTQKNRIFLKNKLNVRYDIEQPNDISSIIEDEVINYVVNKKNIDAIIISDYDKGFITEKLCKTIINYANNNNIPTFVDPKLKNYMKYNGCFLFKPNQNEAETISGEKHIHKILNFIKDKIACKHVLLTRGKEGMILNNVDNKIQHDSIINLVDVTGAGDTVLSTLVYCYLKKGNLFKACKISNYIGGKSVGVNGNYIVSIKEIEEYNEKDIEEYNEKDVEEYNEKDVEEYNEKDVEEYNEKDVDLKSKIIYDYEYEKINKICKNNNIVFTNGCFDILHSAHIELLKFSKTQGEILVVGLNSDDSIKRLKGETRPINDINERSYILSLFDFIDYIIIFSEDTPLNILKLIKPSVLIKGSDYNKDNIIGKKYAQNIILFNFIKNKSSTNIINKIKNV
jgi:D-beta-D-heptose 7-phosphate kinase/D-beta-D-heptose 1-phosphate adenosyltransferase